MSVTIIEDATTEEQKAYHNEKAEGYRRAAKSELDWAIYWNKPRLKGAGVFIFVPTGYGNVPAKLDKALEDFVKARCSATLARLAAGKPNFKAQDFGLDLNVVAELDLFKRGIMSERDMSELREYNGELSGKLSPEQIAQIDLENKIFWRRVGHNLRSMATDPVATTKRAVKYVIENFNM